MHLVVVRVLWKMMPCMEASSLLLLKGMIRREVGPLRVGAQVCPEAENTKVQDNRDTVSKCVEVMHVCVCI